MTDTTIVVIQLFLTALTGVMALVPTYYKMKAQREREQASGAHDVADSAMSMVDRWEARATELECRLKRVEKEMRYWQRGATMLIKQVLEAGLEPVFDPNGGPCFTDEGELSGGPRGKE